MSTKTADALLPTGRDVPFAEIEATLARLVRDGRRSRRPPARALTATVIVVGGADRLVPAAEALEQLGDTGGVRAILISEGTHTSPVARVTENAIAISGLAPRFLNNAVAALRLSSLPAVVWWRGGSVEALDDLAELADRLILDVEEPDAAWSRATQMVERTAVTDLRWTRLTRWRSALAHLFDLPAVRQGAGGIARLSIEATDRAAARLFAGWLRSCLHWTPAVAIEIRVVPQPASETPSPLVRVSVSGPDLSLSLQVKEGRGCLAGAIDGRDGTARIVPLGDGTLASLIAEELGVRTRDPAFEQALASAQEIRA